MHRASPLFSGHWYRFVDFSVQMHLLFLLKGWRVPDYQSWYILPVVLSASFSRQAKINSLFSVTNIPTASLYRPKLSRVSLESQLPPVSYSWAKQLGFGEQLVCFSTFPYIVHPLNSKTFSFPCLMSGWE